MQLHTFVGLFSVVKEPNHKLCVDQSQIIICSLANILASSPSITILQGRSSRPQKINFVFLVLQVTSKWLGQKVFFVVVFFFFETKWKKMDKQQKHHEGWSLGTRRQKTLGHLNSHNMEAWIVEQLSACCDYGCMLNTDYIRVCKSGNSVKLTHTHIRNRKLLQ